MINLTLQTDQSGANDPISSASNRIFNFTLIQQSYFLHADFVMKKGSQSTDGVTASIYSAFNGSGSLITSVFVSSNDFTQIFSSIIFGLDYTLSSGEYSLVLSSLTNSGGNSDYFIKSGNLQIVNTETGSVQTFDQNGSIVPNGSPSSSEVVLETSSSTSTPNLLNKWRGKRHAGHFVLNKGILNRLWPDFF